MKSVLIALLCAGFTFARAESFKIRISHDTRVGSVTLPAGDYYLHMPVEAAAAPRILISSPDGREVEVAVSVAAAANAAKPEVVTVREGRDRHWREIRVAGKVYTFETAAADVSSGS